MIGRLLLWLLALVGLGLWLARMLAAPRRPRGGPAASGPGQPASDGRMVRDRVCNTFLPRSSALTTRIGGEEHFFCSENCRQRFLAGQGAASG